MHLEYRVIRTQAGWCGFVATARGLRRVILPHASAENVRRQIEREFPDARENPHLMPRFAQNLQRYFAGEPVTFDVRIDTTGWHDFERDVWSICRNIGYGRTATYRDLAERLGRPGGARAVGLAMRRNPCPIVVPCHRVVRSDGSLGGYSGPGGVRFKRRLLEMEAAACEQGVRT